MHQLSAQLDVTDTLILLWLLGWLVLGLVKGFVWQIARLVTVVGGCVLAVQYAPGLARLSHRIFPSIQEPADRYLSYFAIFLAVAVVVTFVAYLLRHVIERLKISSYDRLLGAVLGVVTGAVLMMVILVALSIAADNEIGLTQAQLKTAVQQSKLLPPTYEGVRSLTLLFPQDVKKVVDPLLENLEIERSPAEGEVASPAGR